MKKITYSVMPVPGIGFAVVRTSDSGRFVVEFSKTREDAEKAIKILIAKEILK